MLRRQDPEAFCKIMDRSRVNFETNGDLSHYVFRGFRPSGKGSEDMQRILSQMGHTHQRMVHLATFALRPAVSWSYSALWQPLVPALVAAPVWQPSDSPVCCVRQARQYGDLSANVEDPAADWDAGGPTWDAFSFSMPGLKGGLSSRVICGESGPMHLVSVTPLPVLDTAASLSWLAHLC